MLNFDSDFDGHWHTDDRGSPKVDHSGIDARSVLEQINSAKKLPLTWNEPSTLLLTSCLSCLTPVLDPIA